MSESQEIMSYINAMPEKDSKSAQWLKKISGDFLKGVEIPTFSSETLEDFKESLSICELRLNSLFPSAIHPQRKSISKDVKFMDTKEFYEEIARDESDADFKKTIQLVMHAFSMQGMRSMDGKRVMVHTTKYSETDSPKRLGKQEALAVARHEMVHGKVEPVISRVGNMKVRKTGSKQIDFLENKPTGVIHGSLYEAQTDSLAIVSSSPEAKSWEDIMNKYVGEFDGILGDRVLQMSALTRLMDYAYPDFSEGLEMLGEAYFQSNGDDFFSSAGEKIHDTQNKNALEEFKAFEQSSRNNNASHMTQAITRLID